MRRLLGALLYANLSMLIVWLMFVELCRQTPWGTVWGVLLGNLFLVGTWLFLRVVS